MFGVSTREEDCVSQSRSFDLLNGTVTPLDDSLATNHALGIGEH